MATGKVSGAVVGKVISCPSKVNTVMNITIEDEEGSQIQCCFFHHVLDFHKMIRVGFWYRFSDPMLQVNNFYKDQMKLELKITKFSSVEQYKEKKAEEPSIGILKPASTLQNEIK